MTRLALIALLATPAGAQDIPSLVTWEGYHAPSTLELHAPTADGPVATLTFKNTMVHQADEDFQLMWNSLIVSIEFGWNIGGTPAERITVTAPEGYVAVPRTLDALEDTTSEIHIYVSGVGS